MCLQSECAKLLELASVRKLLVLALSLDEPGFQEETQTVRLAPEQGNLLDIKVEGETSL